MIRLTTDAQKEQNTEENLDKPAKNKPNKANKNKIEDDLKDDIEEAKKNLQDFLNGKKPYKNDPCPCGSGNKYKDCHGKSGPKIGSFAK